MGYGKKDKDNGRVVISPIERPGYNPEKPKPGKRPIRPIVGRPTRKGINPPSKRGRGM